MIKSIYGIREGFGESLRELKQVDLTFGNNNYTGSYVALILLLLITAAVDKKNITIIRLISGFLLSTTIFLFISDSNKYLVTDIYEEMKDLFSNKNKEIAFDENYGLRLCMILKSMDFRRK